MNRPSIHITTDRVLHAYIRTGMKPLWGEHSWLDDEENPTRACPIGVLCLEAGDKPCNIDSTSLYEHFTGDSEVAWIDGFTAGWEEPCPHEGYSPEEHGYSAYPAALQLYDRGYQRGIQMKEDFIRLGLRAA